MAEQMKNPDVRSAAPATKAPPQQANPVTAAATTAPTAKAPVAKTVVTTVKMNDGRPVDFPGKRRLQKESFVKADGTLQVRLDFLNGETRLVTLHKDLITKFATHGAEQKLGDEMAGETDLDDAIEAVDQLITRLDAGEWSQERASGGMAGTSVLIRALVEWTGKSVDQIRNFIKPKSQTEKLALRASVAPNKAGVSIKSIVDRLEAEKASKIAKVDISASLAELAG